jgi:rod shape-determining protein MreC
MEPFFTRYRNLIVLLAILMAQILGLAMQVRRTDEGRSTFDPKDPPGVRLVRLWAESLVAPPEQAIHGAKMGAIQLWQNYIDLRHARRRT